MSKVFKKRLNEMIKDEKKAPKDYSKLINATKSPVIKRKIRGIQKQERNHYKILKNIKGRKK
jgi:rubrerythrin